MVNALSIATLVGLHGGAAGTDRHGARGVRLWLRIGRGLVTHQLILAIALGVLVNLAGVGIPPVVDGLTDILSTGALPIALLTVGAGLRLRALTAFGRAMATGVLVKLALLPAVAYGLALAIGMEGAPLLVAMIFAALPSSASGYHMARQMGGDGPLIAGIITAQTLLAVATLPLVILLVR
jgi:hypothetical protein